MYALQKGDVTLKFNRSDYVLTSEDYGSIQATHSTAKGVEQTGEKVVNTTLDTRPVEIVGFIKAKSREEMASKKAALYKLCDPRESFLILPTEDVALECRADNTVQFTASKLTNNERVAQFVIDATAHDPLFRDAVSKAQVITEWASRFEWPIEIPASGFSFAERSPSLIATLDNGGDVETGLLIYFSAETTVENPVLTDIETGEIIKLNRTFRAGETVVVNTNYGQEGAVSYIGDAVEDVINSLDLSSSFIQVPPGSTRLHFTADSNTDSMTVTIYFYQRFLGV